MTLILLMAKVFNIQVFSDNYFFFFTFTVLAGQARDDHSDCRRPQTPKIRSQSHRSKSCLLRNTWIHRRRKITVSCGKIMQTFIILAVLRPNL